MRYINRLLQAKPPSTAKWRASARVHVRARANSRCVAKSTNNRRLAVTRDAAAVARCRQVALRLIPPRTKSSLSPAAPKIGGRCCRHRRGMNARINKSICRPKLLRDRDCLERWGTPPQKRKRPCVGDGNGACRLDTKARLYREVT